MQRSAKFTLYLLLTSVAFFSLPNRAHAQAISAEERFQDLFVTAGYGTAFGAAMGTALLSFQDQPNKKLRYIAVGASLGFISGSILGSYIVFSPVFVNARRTAMAPPDLGKDQFLSISPMVDTHSGQVRGAWGSLNLASF